ncbi:MAG: helix-turn-helix domain-containing protein [Muribaculaceae bacterium]|nr:helix-turn-helix domain-containing protein [Muribaculaceae bacterium]
MEIGNIIRNRRQNLRATQQALSEMSGVSVRMIKAIEGGYANPSIGTLDKILNVLGLQLTVIDKQELSQEEGQGL